MQASFFAVRATLSALHEPCRNWSSTSEWQVQRVQQVQGFATPWESWASRNGMDARVLLEKMFPLGNHFPSHTHSIIPASTFMGCRSKTWISAETTETG